MRHQILLSILVTVTVGGSLIGKVVPSADARELDQETYQLLSYGMTEAEVVGRAGQPDRRIDQLELTPLSQRIISYQYIWGGDTSKGEWTTIVTFSSNMNKVIRIDRERR